MARYRKNGVVIEVCYIPGRKKKALIIGDGLIDTKVASFDDEEAAEWFEKTLDQFLGVKHETRR